MKLCLYYHLCDLSKGGSYMKKKALFMGILSATVLLAGCGPAQNQESSGADANTVRRTALSNFVKGVAKCNLTMETKGYYSSRVYYMGADAFVEEDVATGAQSGVLVNGDQGLYGFDIEGDELVFAGCEGLSNDIPSYYITPATILADDDFMDYYVLTGEDLTFDFDTATMVVSDYQFLYYTCALLLGNGEYYTYVSSLSLKLNEAGNEGTLTLKLKVDSSKITGIATFKDIGTTSVKAVADYLESPKEMATPTDFTASTKAVIKSVFADNASDIVFPTGLITAAYNDTPLTSSNTYVGAAWYSFGKDLHKKYGKMLESKGYEYQEADQDDNGVTHYYYAKAIKDQTDTEGRILIIFDLYYTSSVRRFMAMAMLAEDSMYFTYDTVAEANSGAIAKINEKATYDIPNLPESSDIKDGIFCIDSTVLYNYNYYWVISVSFASEEAATSYAETYIASLASTNYKDGEEYTLDEDGQVQYYAPSTSNPQATIIVAVGQLTGGDYAVNIAAAGY